MKRHICFFLVVLLTGLFFSLQKLPVEACSTSSCSSGIDWRGCSSANMPGGSSYLPGCCYGSTGPISCCCGDKSIRTGTRTVGYSAEYDTYGYTTGRTCRFVHDNCSVCNPYGGSANWSVCSGTPDPGNGDPDPEPEPCVRCSVSCPSPLSSSAPASPYIAADYFFKDFRYCDDTGDCTSPTRHFIDCYEVPQPQPKTKLDIFPREIPTTSYGFTSNTYTGAGKYTNSEQDDSVNEPMPVRSGNQFHMVATYTDDKSRDDIEAVYVWFNQNGIEPKTPKVFVGSGERRTLNTSEFGFMLVRNSSNKWIPYVPYIINSNQESISNKWVKTTVTVDGGKERFSIYGPTGKKMVEVIINEVKNVSSKAISFNFGVSFNSYVDSSVTNGRYYIFLKANNTFGFTPYDNYAGNSNYPYPEINKIMRDRFLSNEIRYYKEWENSNKTWNIDLEEPSSSLSLSIEGQEIVYTWKLNDKLGIYGVVGNLYRSSEFEELFPFVIKSLSPAGSYPKSYTPNVLDKQKVGHLENDFFFKIINGAKEGSVRIDPGENRKGEITLFLTAFDNGGNPASPQSFLTFDLRDWIVTKGGLFYSRDGVKMKPKPLDLSEYPLWDAISLLRNIEPETSDLSTELIGTTTLVDGIFTLPEKSPPGSAYSINPYDIKDYTSYYNELKSLFERRKASLIDSGRLEEIDYRDTLGGGKIKLIDITGDLTVNQNFNCNGKGIIFVSGNLLIQGKIVNESMNSDACIFVVGQNVNIREDGNASSGGFGYDEVNAYIFADGKIIIEKEDASKSIYDGLYISGGIHALNRHTDGEGILLRRYLKLSERYRRPVLAVNHHSKYGVFARELFGSQVSIQKTEVGFK